MMDNDKPHNSSVIKKQQEARNLQSDLECVLLALLSSKYKFTIAKPQKKAEYSRQFIKVKNMIKFDDLNFTFHVQKFFKKCSLESISLSLKNGLTQKTAKRRSQAYKRRLALHLFEDLLLEDGFLITTHKENREGIIGDVTIYKNNLPSFSKNDIQNIGPVIWDFLNERLGSSLQVTIDFSELSCFLNTQTNL
ncbi:hypothetical protein EIN_135000 [Entamoeba invadens IP1]|uniref:Uncharacterized protein n=1 Tax=Entamoeba invadens IP1 TaxID=370355 RepID=A0A0A1U0A3_ENTIV|nr:hypothetical protein EIN_135000 [Entamoeba invadens IP1]ELP85916.1 hypothetical protein EIN_135000 [Entamoeba invadens IP1]|eukprot:XP_004185262.1 hypothetical protein EIN_135000 [Entamoeba invadens IP1]